MLRPLLASALTLGCIAAAHADGPSPRCEDAAKMRAPFEPPKGSWTVLTPEQRAFMAGVFSIDPMTPAGLPLGDKAVLAQRNEMGRGGIVFFLDGERACDPIPVPEEMIHMLVQIGAGEVKREGAL